MECNHFQNIVWTYYRQSGRHELPWRLPESNGYFDPYKILLSEIMLQQTQVRRVVTKYEEFISIFPTVQDLAQASQADIIRLWNGLGYNRRARFLHQTAQIIHWDFHNLVPMTIDDLVKLPGIGKNTAAATVVYAYNYPAVFIETNIRSVFIHHFFGEQTSVSDQAIMPIIKSTLNEREPRQWYWALMDYGSYLKSLYPALSKRSQSYITQAKFKGSKRQIRGQILRLLSERPYKIRQLKSVCHDQRLTTVLQELKSEGLISYRCQYYSL
jgi:A/G-specific adenine glycosylase